MLIADEVHSAGASERRLGLVENYKYRLGLSATPHRYFDDDGTRILINYFGGVVYELGLAKAIQDGFLCEYEYYPYFVGLTQDESRIYRRLTQKIARLWNDSKSSSPEMQSLLERYIFQRTRIVTNAQEKISKFKEIVEEIEHLTYCLVYCSEVQMEGVQRILDAKLISNHQITAELPKKQEDRIRYLDLFQAGLYDVIVAIKVLDEGLNIPAVKDAIILASTGNPKQYIQRRGRVLRKYSSKYKDGTTKKFARIFDILVIPEFVKSEDPILYEIERSIVKKEIVRYEEMANLSRNSDMGLEQLKKIKKMYDL
jgi:superfamily II DNA or RNA helicase